MSTPDLDHLADRLRKASAAYYGPSGPIMSDAAFDALELKLRKSAPDHPVFAEVGAPSSSGWAKVSHPVPMGSLNKAQTLEDFNSWAVDDEEDLIVSDKLDGISILMTYEKGELVRAETRGDGEVGDDITRNVRVMQGVPSHILYDETCYIRGEIVCCKTDFAEHFPGEPNPRNTASGTAKRQTNWQKAKHLTVYAYNITSSNPEHRATSRSEEFDTLDTWGFKTPNYFHVTREQVADLRDRYIATLRASCNYDIDGLVIEVDNTEAREAYGENNLRPKGAIAFKFEHESGPTVLRDIVWQVGNSGRVTPVAVFDAVNLAGADLQRASLHNVKRVARLRLFRGCAILVSRRNDVIPMVEANLDLGISVHDEI